MQNQRERYGLVATFECDGELLSITRHGKPLAVLLREIVADLRDRHEQVRLVCVSTPATILEDVSGDRRRLSSEHHVLPEHLLVGRAKLGRELLHERLRPRRPSNWHARRRYREGL